MTHPNNIAYQLFVKLYIEANQNEKKSKQVLLSEAMISWKANIKKSQKDPFDRSAFEQQTDMLRGKIEDRRKRQSIKLCFIKQQLSSPSPGTSSMKTSLSSVFEIEDIELDENVNPIDTQSTSANINSDEQLESRVEDTEDIISDGVADDVTNGPPNAIFDSDVSGDADTQGEAQVEEAAEHNILHDLPVIGEKPDLPTPKQDELKASLNSVNSQLLTLQETYRIPILDDVTRKHVKDKIAQAGKMKKGFEKQLRRVKQYQKHTKKYRVKKKKAIQTAIQLFPEVATILKGVNRDSPGNPRIECNQPEILEEILKIAEIGSACSDRRRDNTVRTVRTLDQLKMELHKLGFQVSRSGIYLKLLPRDAKSIEGRRHVSTVPVKLTKPQNNLRKGHKDRLFARETCFAVDNIAATLGPEACTYLSQDDKSHVAIGITCAKVQAPMLMSMAQRVRLPDHDFVIGSKHKLTPSVMGKCEIDPVKGVTYSGLTYVSVRSSKHNNSSALTHMEDLNDMIENNLELFESDNDDYKPVLIKSVDGGPDENPRFEKNILAACQIKKKYQYDAVIEVTNAPGLSAYNRVERRMHPLSLSMAGVILPHDTFGTHLDNQGQTVDLELEKENFAAAGKVLANVFSNITIDGHEVQARYVPDAPNIQLLVDQGGKYRDRHVIETQYMTVVLSCDDRTCCPPPRTSIQSFFPGRRVPALIPIVKAEFGPVALEMLPNIHKKQLEFLDMFGRIVLEKQLVPEGSDLYIDKNTFEN